MKCKYCDGEVNEKICIKCLMPQDIPEKEKEKNNE